MSSFDDKIDFINKLLKELELQIEKTQSPASRSGHTVERVAKMVRANVDKEVIALQMTKTSHHKQKYTTQDIASYSKLYKDAETNVVITAEQTERLIKDQQSNSPDGDPLPEN